MHSAVKQYQSQTCEIQSSFMNIQGEAYLPLCCITCTFYNTTFLKLNCSNLDHRVLPSSCLIHNFRCLGSLELFEVFFILFFAMIHFFFLVCNKNKQEGLLLFMMNIQNMYRHPLTEISNDSSEKRIIWTVQHMLLENVYLSLCALQMCRLNTPCVLHDHHRSQLLNYVLIKMYFLCRVVF